MRLTAQWTRFLCKLWNACSIKIEIKEFCMLGKRLFGIMTFIVGILLVFSLIGCGEKENGDSELSGNVTITPNTNVMAGIKLTAAYIGSESVGAARWKRDGTVVYDGNEYIPNQSGSYTATVYSMSNINVSKTSTPVNVTDFTGLGGNLSPTDGKMWVSSGNASSLPVAISFITTGNSFIGYLYGGNNQYTINHYWDGTWFTNGSVLTIEFALDVLQDDNYTYSVVGDELILSDGSTLQSYKREVGTIIQP